MKSAEDRICKEILYKNNITNKYPWLTHKILFPEATLI
jgi:hypothetical protein